MRNKKKVDESARYQKLLKSSCCEAPLISVIVPVYNSRPYLEECLDSLRRQSLYNIEIICVDDGSTDNSLKLLLDTAKKDDRIAVITKDNSGPSDTRNCGIDSAKGKYIYFCDSDDYLERDSLEACYAKAENDNLDIVLFSAAAFEDDESCAIQIAAYQKYYYRKHDYSGLYTGIELFAKMQMHKEYLMAPCLYIVKKSHLDKYGHRFISGSLHEDNAFTFEVLISAEKAGFINKEYYHRRLHANSIMTKQTSMANVEGLLMSYVHMIKFLERYRVPEAYNDNVMRQLAITLQSAQSCYNKLEVDDKQMIDAENIIVRILYHNIIIKGRHEAALKEKAIKDYHTLKDYTDKHINKLKEANETLKNKADIKYYTLKEYTDQHISRLKEVITQMKENNKILQEHGNRARDRQQAEKATNSKLLKQNADLQRLLAQEKERNVALEQALLVFQNSFSFKIGRAITYFPRLFCKVFNSK